MGHHEVRTTEETLLQEVERLLGDVARTPKGRFALKMIEELTERASQDEKTDRSRRSSAR